MPDPSPPTPLSRRTTRPRRALCELVRRGLTVAAFAALGLVSITASAQPNEPLEEPAEAIEDGPLPTLTYRPVLRDGFHFQVAFGMGGGPDSSGVFHAMEIGGTFPNGWTLALLHTFIQNKGVLAEHGGPDLFGGWMPELKIPLGYDDLVAKVAAGPGGIHIQDDGIDAVLGLAWLYGVDFHIPFFPTSGLSLGLQMLHAHVDGKHHMGLSTSLGYTWF